jgi:hypothetical protein
LDVRFPASKVEGHLCGWCEGSSEENERRSDVI